MNRPTEVSHRLGVRSFLDELARHGSRNAPIAGWTIREHVPKIPRMAPIPLSAINGADIGAAQRSLPPCGPDSPPIVTADVDAQHIGRVRITFTKSKATRGRSKHWFWVAERADLVSSHVCDRKGPRERVVDESHEPPITGIYPTCSVCGVPQVFGERGSNAKQG